ncbi:helicase-related protein [Frankia sp. R82]|uniref:helicase-related protein n=1 Tax=Frankia sp. R82 TaxID=2950553 RepID=UPI0020447C70|nr:helicase-related protein [Frankia sp. R82]MCM3886257.1 hypothetical protein [Frankia sp. R82]
MRGAQSPVRVVGLSATVANAGDIAAWLGARVVTTDWRPTRLTWQLPMIPATRDRRAENSSRARAAVALARQVTGDGGSVLVFCGSRRIVRTTALAIAADRGATITGVDPDDVDRVHQVCASARVGLHYKDWEHRHAAERDFRARRLDVLVATTTVAAGVNLPARAVVVRDTQVGLDQIDVATVQQMFGRAGRVGAGETEGWAFLVCSETERTAWQNRLVDGYTVRSRIEDGLADHLLAEAASGRVPTLADAEAWWLRTLAHHQGADGGHAVRDAVDLLVTGGYLTVVGSPHTPADAALIVTELGQLTNRFMIPVEVGIELRDALDALSVPTDPQEAEWLLGGAVARLVASFAEAPVNDDLRPRVAALLRARGRPDHVEQARPAPGLVPPTGIEPGDLAQVAFGLVAASPKLFTRPARTVAGLPTSMLTPILAEAPRYLAWLAAQGALGTVHPWAAVSAGDLGRRIRWRRLGAPRGAGRLLWICERMATAQLADEVVPALFTAARRRDVTNPDWPVGRPPKDCRLDGADYLALLRDRATDASAVERGHQVSINGPASLTAVLWAGPHRHVVADLGADPVPYPTGDASSDPRSTQTSAPSVDRGVALFTRSGDCRCSGWLAVYNGIESSAGSLRGAD